MTFRPMKAETAELHLIQYPVFVQPKIDGVRGINRNGKTLSRTLKPFGNRFANEFLSHQHFFNLDGEIWVWNEMLDRSPSLCRDTTSALNSHAGQPKLCVTAFDLTDERLKSAPYEIRYQILSERINAHRREFENSHIFLIPNLEVRNETELLAAEERVLSAGYEGLIIRNPNSPYKYGRSTAREGGLLRIKRFVDEEAIITGFVEAEANLNPQTVDNLGLSTRSSHSENKVGKSMIGAVEISYRNRRELIGPGELTHTEREYYFANPEKFIGQLCTFKHFPHGAKDKLRMATFKHLRLNSI